MQLNTNTSQEKSLHDKLDYNLCDWKFLSQKPSHTRIQFISLAILQLFFNITFCFRYTEASEGSNKNEERANWRFSMIPKLRKSVHRSSDRRASKEQVLQLPASQLKTASHRGYLNKRSKRKLWEK